MYYVNKLPNFCQMLPYSAGLFSRMDEGKGDRGLGKGCDFHLQRPEPDLCYISGACLERLHLNQEQSSGSTDSCIHLLHPVTYSDGSQELKSRELCQFYKGQAGGDSGSEPVFQSMPWPLWFSSSVISAMFSGSCWLLPCSQNNAC